MHDWSRFFCPAADARVKRFSILSLFWKFFYLMYLLYLLLVVLHLLRGRFVEGAVCLLKMLTGNNLDVKYGFCAVRVTWRSFQFYLWLWQDIAQYAEEFAAALMPLCRGALVAFPLLYKGSFIGKMVMRENFWQTILDCVSLHVMVWILMIFVLMHDLYWILISWL